MRILPISVTLVFLLVFSVQQTTNAAQSGIEIEIRNTENQTDDYLTWAPAPARIRQHPDLGDTDLKIVLTNDATKPIPTDREQPLDGDLVFDINLVPGQTIEKDQLKLVLPHDGTWVDFFVAGKYPRASTRDKDAVIEVHKNRSDGPILHRHGSMVRIRKNHTTLTPDERKRFLEALRYLRWTAKTPQGKGLYREFVRLHSVAAGARMRPPVYPDLAHKGPGFIAWHRAFLLHFERSLQKHFPDVALPYWVMSEESTLFSKHFVGANDVVEEDIVSQDANLHATNPIFGWTIDGSAIPRWSIARGGTTLKRFESDEDLFKRTTYSNYPKPIRPNQAFADQVESNPHNNGHGWIGAWMNDCQTSPSDPIFWIFHSGFDRAWAKWQFLHNKVDPTGAGDSYHPLGTFETQYASEAECNALGSNRCIPIGHSAKDSMWPWNDKWGPGATIKGSWPPKNLLDLELFFTNFPKASIQGLWPSAPAKPRPIDMIDYAGITASKEDMGFAYDDVPYGVKPSAKELIVGSEERVPSIPLSAFFDKNRGESARLEAGTQIDPSSLTEGDNIDKILEVFLSQEESSQVRQQALQLLRQQQVPQWLDQALGVLQAPEAQGVLRAPETQPSTPVASDEGKLKADLIGVLMTTAMLTAEGRERNKEIFNAIRSSINDPRRKVQVAMVQAMAPMGDQRVLEMLKDVLREPTEKTLTPVDAMQGIRISGQQKNFHELIRPYLNNSDFKVRIEAVKTLAGDAESENAIAALILDGNHPVNLRSAAIATLTGGSDGPVTDSVRKLMLDADADPGLRAEAAATLGVYILDNANSLTIEQFSDMRTDLERLIKTQDPDLKSIVERTMSDLREIMSSKRFEKGLKNER